MKKTQTTILICFLAICTLTVSCKKEEEISPKEVTQNLLVKKWYYHNFTATNSNGVVEINFNTSLGVADVFEFKSDGTIIEDLAIGSSTYTISDDGKKITVTKLVGGKDGSKIPENISITIKKITETELELNYNHRDQDRVSILKSTPR